MSRQIFSVGPVVDTARGEWSSTGRSVQCTYSFQTGIHLRLMQRLALMLDRRFLHRDFGAGAGEEQMSEWTILGWLRKCLASAKRFAETEGDFKAVIASYEKKCW